MSSVDNEKEDKGESSNSCEPRRTRLDKEETKERDGSGGEKWQFPTTFDFAFPKQGEFPSSDDDLKFMPCQDEEVCYKSSEGNEKEKAKEMPRHDHQDENISQVTKVPNDAVPIEDKGISLKVALGDEVAEQRKSQGEKEKSDGYFSSEEFDVEIGNKNDTDENERGKNSTEELSIDKKLSQPVHVHTQLEVQMGTLVDIETGSNSSNDNSTLSSHRRKKMWERLPVATPVFDAEVVIWDFDRPEYKQRFGRGFRNPEKKKTEEEKPHDPIFTEKDKSNIFRFIGKLIGIILALPLFFIYWLFTFGWVSPLLDLVDVIFAKPIGKMIDCAMYSTANTFWFFYQWVLVSLYKCVLVYPGRILCKFTLASITIFLKIGDWLVEIFVAMISSIARFVKNCVLLPCFQLVRFIVLWIYANILKRAFDGVVLSLKCILQTIIKPLFGGFVSGLKCMHEWVLQPIGKAFLCVWGVIVSSFKCIYKSIVKCFISLWEGFVSGLKCMHEWVLQPIGKALLCVWGAIAASFKCIYKSIVKCFIGLWEGFVSGLKCVYEWVLQPIGRGFMGIAKVLCFAFTWTLTSVRDFVIKPIGNGISAVFRALYRFIIVPIGSSISFIISFLASVIKAIGVLIKNIFLGIVKSVSFAFIWTLTSVRDYVIKPIGNAVSAFFGAFHRFIIVPIGNFFSSIISFIANVVKNIASALHSIFSSIGSFIASVGRSIVALFGGR